MKEGTSMVIHQSFKMWKWRNGEDEVRLPHKKT